MADEVLRLNGIRKSYGGGRQIEVEVLHGIDVALQEGELVALVGPSGSGKSTLLNIMGLLERPTAGELYLAGQATSGLDDDAVTALRSRYLGFCFQYHHLIPAFSALENVMMPMLAAERWPSAAMRERATGLLERVGLSGHMHKRPGQLSGGQQQRVAIVRALAMQPRLVLADEPTGNLDTRSAAEVFGLMQEINRSEGVTFLIVTHDLNLAGQCRRRLEIVDGQLV